MKLKLVFYLTHLAMFADGWGIRQPGLILYTSHLLARFNLGRPPVKFNGGKMVAWMDVGLAGSVRGKLHFLSIECSYRGFGVSE